MAKKQQAMSPGQNPGELVIARLNTFTDPQGNLRIVGLIKNKTGDLVKSIQLLADIRDDSGNSLLRDESGQVVDGKPFYPEITTLIPGESSPFSFIYNQRNGATSSYEIRIINYQVGESTRADPVISIEESKPDLQIPETSKAEIIPVIPVDVSRHISELEAVKPKPEAQLPAHPELDSVVQQFVTQAGEDLIATVVTGPDGNILSSRSNDPAFNSTITAASITPILQLAARAGAKINLGKVENNMTTTDKVYFIARFIGDGSYNWGVIILKSATIGFIRLLMNEFAEKIWLKVKQG
ncbi:MAG: hypothetical protein C3F13_02650 [Anaerolineales bacterium]|nr:MAG: hypothetical protein C3F13_02650 [Anaerolineales bacterium]